MQLLYATVINNLINIQLLSIVVNMQLQSFGCKPMTLKKKIQKMSNLYNTSTFNIQLKQQLIHRKRNTDIDISGK